jgi:hypothetical protein
MRKRTVFFTTSRKLHQAMDNRMCLKKHSHQTVAGSVRFKGTLMRRSKFAENYANQMAKKIAETIIQNQGEPLI